MKYFIFIITLLLVSTVIIPAQDLIDIDFDILDSLFDEPLTEVSPVQEEIQTVQTLSNLRRRGLTVNTSYSFRGAAAPGWDMPPWDFNGEEIFDWGQAVLMRASFEVTAQISEVFRVVSNISFEIPGFHFALGDFFFDYNFYDTVFMRAGKYEQSWGISPNFGFTNLLSRVPEIGPSGEAYTAKADIPVGIGGFQVIALTRVNINANEVPNRDQIGFGAKYNLAFRWADFDLGVFYQEHMATRGIFSVKTTLWNTELYNEWLLAANTHSDNSLSFAVNTGFARDFFNKKLEVNGEIFYNGEGNTFFFRPETDYQDSDTSPFIEGLNLAFNLLYRFGGRGNPRFFLSMLYAPEEDSMQLVPGFRLTPFQHIDIYLAVPMALGNKDGYYYKNTFDPFNRPFSIMLYITLSGSVQAGYFY